ncbi:MAG: carboxypeptidase-like regulatory domain-containing protein [Thermoguttaceae bacterium]
MPELTPATVTVTYKGQPVEGATVALAPKSGTFSAGGMTDAAGKAVLKTNGTYDGVAPGEFSVSISKVEAASASGSMESSADPAAYAQSFESSASGKPKSLIPEKYSSFETSALTLTAAQGSPVDQKFDLTD